MNITNVKIFKLEDNKVLALVSITLDNEFVVSGLKILNGQNGMWVAMPNRKDSKNEYHDIAFPITKEAREIIQKSVLDKYVPFSDQDTSHEDMYPQKNDRQREYESVDVKDKEILPF